MEALQKKDFEGQTALVTGAQQGIGKAIAVKLASMGADIIINWFDDEEKATEVAEIVTSYGQKVKLIKADISNVNQIKGALLRT